jgi:hypothetical protein
MDDGFYRSLASRLRSFALTARSAVARLEGLRLAREVEQQGQKMEVDGATAGDKPANSRQD